MILKDSESNMKEDIARKTPDMLTRVMVNAVNRLTQYMENEKSDLIFKTK